ncbi:MAG: hypothetical protein JSS49_00280 [Planctomycetes bacterium]|nr:hypothetical protein [Planctomycetota bacterium]
MPQTVNGIGTHYYGKQDVARRSGTCRHCGKSGNLETYTTRLWFVILFIPIIPLKRIRILDYCSSCTRHWVVNPEEYEMSRQLSISGAMEKHRAEPTVETALIAHAQYLSFHMYSEADAFRQGVLTQFPDNPELLLGLAGHLDQTGRWMEATPMYEQVLALKPESTDARFHLAWRRTNEGKLDEAYDLLDYLRERGSGVSFNLEPLKTLAVAYQKVGQHEKTLELCAVYLREHPPIGELHEFRTLVKKSEKALGLETSLLPRQEVSLRGLFDTKSGKYPPWMRFAAFLSVAVVLLAVTMAALNEYRRTHRTLYIVSAFAQPVQVSVDGGPAVTVNQQGTVPISEGAHQITLSGPVNRQINARLQSPYLSRWLSSPIWVLNVEHLSGIYVNKIMYAVNPSPSKMTWLEDEDVNFVPHVDYPFTTPPATMKVEGNNGTITKYCVAVQTLPPSTIALQIMSQPDQTTALTFIEGHLERNRDDALLLGSYTNRVVGEANEKRVAEFLKERLWKPSISVVWHRAYMNLKSEPRLDSQLRAEYDARLTQSPDDPTLLYLRGRVSPTRQEQVTYFQRSFDKDPNTGWSTMALGFDAAHRGDWDEAKKWCNKVNAFRGADPSFRLLRHLVHVALADTSGLENEYRQTLRGNDLVEMLTAVFRLLDVLAAQSKFDEARTEYAQFMKRISSGATVTGMSPYDLVVDYVCGDTEEFLKKQPDIPAAQASIPFVCWLVATGQPDIAASLPDVDTLVNEWDDMLAISVSFALNGKTDEAAAWRAKACEQLKKMDGQSQRLAEILERDTAPDKAELMDIVVSISEMPLVLAALAQRFPDQKADLSAWAAKLNVSRHAPYMLVKQVVESP